MTLSSAAVGAVLGVWAAVCVPVAGWSTWRAFRSRAFGWAFLGVAALALTLVIGGSHLLLAWGPPFVPLGGLIPVTILAIAYPVRTHQRVPFRIWVATVWLSIFALLAVFFFLADFDRGWIRENGWFIMGGIWWTMVISIAAIILAIILALLGSLGRLSKNPIAYGVSGFYTSFFRGTPLIVQLFLIYLALPQIVQNLDAPRSVFDFFTLDALMAGIIGIGLNYGAYMTEIFRAGIQSISHGQREAAEALGMSYRQVMRHVVLPQAFRVVVPPTGNEFIAMMKDTALVSFLGATLATMELFRRAQLLGNADFKPLEAFLVAAAMYWMLTAILSFFQAKIEHRMGRGHIRVVEHSILTGVTGRPGGVIVNPLEEGADGA